ncbi:MAG: peptidylprolyl isomerase [Acidobacteriota bacterium]
MTFKKCFIFLGLAGVLLAQAPLREDPNAVVATVDGKNVTKGDLRQMFLSAEPNWMNLFKTNPQFALSQWFIIRQLGKEAEARKLDQQSPAKEQVEYMRLSILAGARMNEEANTYPVSNQMVAEYFKQHQSQYQHVRVKGIYIKFKPQVSQMGTSPDDVARLAQLALNAASTGRSEAEARKLSLEIVARLRAGEDIAKLVAQYSEDETSKAKGGDIGAVTPINGYPDNFKKVALGLAVGQVSEPIAMPAGFYIIRAEEKGVQDITEVAGDIVGEIRKVHLDEFNKALNDRFRAVVRDTSVFTQPQVFISGGK